MRNFFTITIASLIFAATSAIADEWPNFVFDAIDGGEIHMKDYDGMAVLVVNTASKCSFNGQLGGMQDLYNRYKNRGATVVAVPSNSFRQELDTNEEVAEFCDINYGTEFPMTAITAVKGPSAHPFYQWVEQQTGFSPGWNFNKILIGPDGKIVNTWNALVRPNAADILHEIERSLVKHYN